MLRIALRLLDCVDHLDDKVFGGNVALKIDIHELRLYELGFYIGDLRREGCFGFARGFDKGSEPLCIMFLLDLASFEAVVSHFSKGRFRSSGFLSEVSGIISCRDIYLRLSRWPPRCGLDMFGKLSFLISLDLVWRLTGRNRFSSLLDLPYRYHLGYAGVTPGSVGCIESELLGAITAIECLEILGGIIMVESRLPYGVNFSCVEEIVSGLQIEMGGGRVFRFLYHMHSGNVDGFANYRFRK
ncbi:hypothetical protein FNV43_RR01145 [Rhamnella rubrinervis]|uniref:Uncharacterized protein n=1 Tax=Rhamnella rubrinervis TaxID=2594499 RepID=A0A8K0HS24_9ROSA|nr:hypothetical protein FNV43_RR01145 [Rhamnella rubrinervis]